MQTASHDLNISQTPGAAIERAPTFIRLLATIIDGLIVGVVTTPVSYLLPLLFAKMGKSPLVATLFSYIFNFIISYYYFGHFYSKRGATPGKQLFRLRVQDEQTGMNLTPMRAFVRETFGKFLSAITLSIGFIMAAFREDSRALHDLVVGSRVVRMRKAS